MIQENLQYLLQHPDISFAAPESTSAIEVTDAYRGDIGMG